MLEIDFLKIKTADLHQFIIAIEPDAEVSIKNIYLNKQLREIFTQLGQLDTPLTTLQINCIVHNISKEVTKKGQDGQDKVVTEKKQHSVSKKFCFEQLQQFIALNKSIKNLQVIFHYSSDDKTTSQINFITALEQNTQLLKLTIQEGEFYKERSSYGSSEEKFRLVEPIKFSINQNLLWLKGLTLNTTIGNAIIAKINAHRSIHTLQFQQCQFVENGLTDLLSGIKQTDVKDLNCSGLQLSAQQVAVIENWVLANIDLKIESIRLKVNTDKLNQLLATNKLLKRLEEGAAEEQPEFNCQNCSFDKARLQKLWDNLANYTSLAFDDCLFTPEALELLGQLLTKQSASKLILTRCQLSNTDITTLVDSLDKQDSLELIDLSDNNFTAEIIPTIAKLITKLPNLKCLSLEHDTNTFLSATNFNPVEQALCNHLQLTEINWPMAYSKYNYLSMQQRQLATNAFIQQFDTGKTTKLELSQRYLNESRLKSLLAKIADPEDIVELMIKNCNTDDTSVGVLAGFLPKCNLIRFTFANCIASTAVFAQLMNSLENNLSLEALTIDVCQPEQLAALTQLLTKTQARLKTLIINWRVEEKQIKAELAQYISSILATQAELTSLEIADGKFTEQALSSLSDGLKSHYQLQSFKSANANNLLDALNYILGANKLLIILKEQQSKEQQSEALTKFPQYYFDQHRIKAVLDWIKANPNKTLHFSNCMFEDKAIDALADYLATDTIIEELRITRCQLTSDQFINLLSKFNNNSTLQQLDVSGNALGNDSMTKLEELLKTTTVKLIKLNLSNNQIDDHGMAKLSDGLMGQLTLCELDLRGNNISGAGLKVLANGLCLNNTLRRLRLPDETIEDAPAKDFFDQLFVKSRTNNNCNTSLIELYLARWKDIPSASQAFWKNERNKSYIQIPNGTKNPYYKDDRQLRNSQIKGFVQDLTDNDQYLEHLIDAQQKKVKDNFAANASNATSLISAVLKGAKDKVENLLKTASLYTCRDFAGQTDGYTLLHIAVEAKHTELVRFFVQEKQFNYRLRNSAGKTSLELAEEKFAAATNDTDKQTYQQIIDILRNPPANTQAVALNFTVTSAPTLKTAAKRRSHERISAEIDLQAAAASSSSEASSSATSSAAVSLEPPAKQQRISVTSHQEADIVMVDAGLQQSTRQVDLKQLVLTGSISQLQQISAQQLADYRDADGNTLLHLAILANKPEVISLLVDKVLSLLEQENTAHEKPLHLVIKQLFVSNGQSHLAYLDLAWLLIRKGATPCIKVQESTDSAACSILQFAVKQGDYRLVKILLHSKLCQADDIHQALHLAIEQKDARLVDRLLIDRRIEPIKLDGVISQIRQQLHSDFSPSNPLITILQLLQRRRDLPFAGKQPGIHWTKHFSVYFGSSYDKPHKALTVDSDKQHAFLKSQNSFAEQRLTWAESHDPKTEEFKDFSGNPVSASLVFITSLNNSFMHGNQSTKQKIRVELNFRTDYHITKNDEEVTPKDEVERVKYRINSVEEETIRQTSRPDGSKAKTAEQIDALYKEETQKTNMTFALSFRHGEQALLDYLEQPETIQQIVNCLIQNHKFTKDMKVLAVILELHSPRYVCENCEIGILGEQNPEKSKFLQNLTSALIAKGYRVPRFSPIRMLTEVSSFMPFHSQAKLEDEHQTVLLDLRSCQNELILSRDDSALETQLTQFHSSAKIK